MGLFGAFTALNTVTAALDNVSKLADGSLKIDDVITNGLQKFEDTVASVTSASDKLAVAPEMLLKVAENGVQVLSDKVETVSRVADVAGEEAKKNIDVGRS
jgi:hypothetical protein